jgi:carboxymethylenebutenolidase
MPNTSATVTTPDGSCPVTLHTPEGDGPWPGVIMYTDAGGVRPIFHQMAAKLADAGYAVLLPDVFYRHGEWQPFSMQTVFSDPTERARLMSMVHSVTPEFIVADAGAFLDFLADRPEVTGDAFGVCGYCMGGKTSMIVAGRHPERMAAMGSFHGGGLVTDDDTSPHLLADRIRATVYLAGASNDASFTPENAATLEQALTAAGVAHEIEIYPAAHGFAVPDNPTYDDAADERHWTALRGLFATALVGEG